MIETAIFGGSFNPIHRAHVEIALHALSSGMVEELWLLVSPQNPLKKNDELLPDELRLRLAKVAVRNYPNIRVSDFEFHLPKPSYMVRTLERMEKAYPDRRFSLLIGADNWERFDKWYQSGRIIERYQILIYPRKGFTMNTDKLPENVRLLEMPLYDISATQIRHALKDGRDVSMWVDSEVSRILYDEYRIARP